MKHTKVRVAIFEDHQSIIDGYLYRLAAEPKIEVVATIFYGEDLLPMLVQNRVDVLLLDVQAPTSAANPNPYPVLHSVSAILQSRPNLGILVISMHTQPVLIQSLVDAGVSGYIYKDDYASIRQLARIILMISNGGMHFSDGAYQQLREGSMGADGPTLSPRQIEALSLCAAYPDDSTSELAERLEVAGSTLRNLLSGAYDRLGVRTRAAAIAKVQKMGMIPHA